MTNSNENTLFAQKEQAPKHLTFSAGVKRLRSHWLSLKGRKYKKGILAHRFVHLHPCRPCAQHRLYYLILHTAGNTL